jgi:nucleotide-binding universal stress UspA family protein
MRDAIIPTGGAVICGVDGSETSEGAIRVARDLSDVLGRRLVFVRVVEPGTPPHEIDAIAEHVRQLAADTDHGDTEALWLVDVGHPADRLLAASEDEHASLVVVGSHGSRSSLLGSISAEVSRRAPCPVVVVPPGAGAAVGGGTNGGRRTHDVGGIARFQLGTIGAQMDVAGGIARFDLAAAARSKES